MRLRNKVRSLVAGTFLLASTLAGGCAHFSLDKNYQGPKPLPEKLKAEYSVDNTAITSRTKRQSEKERYTKSEIELTCVQKNKTNIVDTIFYRPNKLENEKSPAIIIYPTNGGSYFIEDLFASNFAEQGYFALIVERQPKERHLEPEKIGELIKKDVIRTKYCVSWLIEQPKVAKDKVGAFGLSRGGMNAVNLIALEDRISVGAIGLASGNIAKIIVTTPELTREREKMMQQQNLTINQLYTKLNSTIECDPINNAQYVDARNVLFISTLLDRIIPFEEQMKLKKAIGNPENYVLPLGHYPAAVSLPITRPLVFHYFKKAFDRKIPQKTN